MLKKHLMRIFLLHKQHEQGHLLLLLSNPLFCEKGSPILCFNSPINLDVYLKEKRDSS